MLCFSTLPQTASGVLEQGACGFTNGDGNLVYPADVYAAAADANEDYPGGLIFRGRLSLMTCQTRHIKASIRGAGHYVCEISSKQLDSNSRQLVQVSSALNEVIMMAWHSCVVAWYSCVVAWHSCVVAWHSVLSRVATA